MGDYRKFYSSISPQLLQNRDTPRWNQWHPPSPYSQGGLCDVRYKIITKTIANRFKTVLPELIAPNRSSFVPGRRITDNTIFFQEVLHIVRRRKGKSGTLIIKIDLEKVCDTLSWNFIRDTLQQAGFNEEWVRSIMTCIETSQLAVLWQGEKLNRFQPGRVICQGDPITPIFSFYALRDLNT